MFALAKVVSAFIAVGFAAPAPQESTSAYQYWINVPCGCHNDCTVKAQFDKINPGEGFCTKQCDAAYACDDIRVAFKTDCYNCLVADKKEEAFLCQQQPGCFEN